MRGAYIYEGLEAEWYDLLDELADFDDFDFYRLCLQASPGQVLDLGCGTGRILVPLVALGETVVGLDASPLMLDQCRARLEREGLDASLFLGDMRRFDLGDERFATILVAGYSIQLLATNNEWIDCLKCCYRHLNTDGQLVLPVYLPWDYIWQDVKEGDLEVRKESQDSSTGDRLRALQGWHLDCDKQVLDLSNVFERYSSGGELMRREEKRMSVHWRLPNEILEMLQTAGYADIAMYGNYGFDAPEPESETIVFVARR